MGATTGVGFWLLFLLVGSLHITLTQKETVVPGGKRQLYSDALFSYFVLMIPNPNKLKSSIEDVIQACPSHTGQ